MGEIIILKRFFNMNCNEGWFAIYTRSHFENRVYCGLVGKSFEVFLPQMYVPSRRKDRKKMIKVPILPGYLFVQTEMTSPAHLDILKVAGVVSILSINGIPAKINSEEIENLKILNGTERPIFYESEIHHGDRVIIVDGPLKGLVGIYLRSGKGKEKVFVSLKLLNRELSVELDGWAIKKINNSKKL